jgi:calcium-dependent protein kinase
MKFDNSVRNVEILLSEVKFWKKVNHPSILPLLDCFDDESFVYILYEYPGGGDFAALITRRLRWGYLCLFNIKRVTVTSSSRGAHTEGFARHVATRLLEALCFMHANGIVHGCCRPNNIVIVADKQTPGWVHTVKLSMLRLDTYK